MATDYVALAKKRIRKPGTAPKRILVYGRNKQGKTTLSASSGEKTLIIDPEGGAEFVPPENVDLWPCSSWQDINDVFRFLQTGKHDYKWVGVDGLTRISNMALRYVMAQQEERDLDRIPGLVQQRDYGRSGELMKGMLYNFHTLPCGIIYTAQDRMDTGQAFDSEDDDSEDVVARFVPDLPKGVRSAVNGIVDVIGRIYTVRVEGTNRKGETIKGVQRRLWLSPSDTYDTGYRSKVKGIPPFIKAPTIPKLISLLDGKEPAK